MGIESKSWYEGELQIQLDYAGYRYWREFKFDRDRRWRVDFYLYDHSLMVEIEGIKWKGKTRHQTADGFTGDCEKYNTLTKMGYRLLRFTPRMVKGVETRGKHKIPMQSAIECINDVCLGARTSKCGRAEGYARRAMKKWPPIVPGGVI